MADEVMNEVFDLMNEGGESIDLFGQEDEGIDVFDAITNDIYEYRAVSLLDRLQDAGDDIDTALSKVHERYGDVVTVEDLAETYKPSSSRDALSEVDKKIYDMGFAGIGNEEEMIEYKELIMQAGYEWDPEIMLDRGLE